MNQHPCQQLVEALRYLQAAGLTQAQLYRLHHFSLTGTPMSFASCYGYFGVNKAIRGNNQRFAERLKLIAGRHRAGGAGMEALVEEALGKWPLAPA